MARTVVFQTSLAGILTPAEHPENAHQDAVAWGASLTVNAGDLVAQKTSDKLMYPYVAGSTVGGIATAKGISMYSFQTGTDGKPIFSGDVATPDYLHPANLLAPIWMDGTYDLTELKIGGVGSLALSDISTAFGSSRVYQQPNGFVKIL